MLKEIEPKEVTTKKRWLQMGVELEGSWKNRKSAAGLVRGARAQDDRSVHIAHGDPGEVITRPHDKLDDLLEDIKILWPESVNDSCGFHIHASFTPMDASIIASKGFYAYFKEQWQLWGTQNKVDRTHEFWTRLAGRNKFAKDVFDPETQLRGFGGAGQNEKRYTLLNFYAWEKHKTVECRLLPMFVNVELALSATRHLSWIYNSYLSTHDFETLTFEPAVKLVGDTVEENYNVKQPDTSPKVYESEGYFPPLPSGEDLFYSIPGAEHQMLPFRKEIKDTTP